MITDRPTTRADVERRIAFLRQRQEALAKASPHAAAPISETIHAYELALRVVA